MASGRRCPVRETRSADPGLSDDRRHPVRTTRLTRSERPRAVPTIGISKIGDANKHLRRLAVLTVVVAGWAALPSPASAHLPERVTVSDSEDSSDRKEVEVSCPVGTRVVGSGADIGGLPAGSGSVVLDDVIPHLDTDVNPPVYKVTTYAYEARGGTNATWSLRAWAVCGDPHGSTTTNSRESAPSSNDKSVEVTCPAGKVVLGTGASITGGHGDVVIDEIIPTTTTVKVKGIEVDFGYAGDWTIRAYAICGDEPGGREIVSRATTSNSEDKGGNAPCDPGKVVFGAGFDLEGAAGGTFIDDLIPTNDSVLTFAMEDWDGSDGNGRDWALRSYAICGTA
jgi:hypothetical protein